MKLKKKLMVAALFAATVYGVQAQQPYSGCWFPEDVINWSPEADPDAKFNRSRIPLAKRFTEPELMKANSNQRYTGYVETATITNKMCSLTPSQGDNNFLGYQPTYWQYMEKFINWGGAGNEGIFVLPPAGTIDAAHMNGVKILGELFFMPRTIGGRDGWIEAMLTTDASGKYPYAIKMYEIAKYFGFDGWFINKELDNGKRVDEWAKFITCFNETADAAGDTYMEIQWYDAKGKPTVEILRSHKNTSQFLEYNNTGNKSEYASELGCSADDILHRLYAGIECVQSGLTGYGSALSSVHNGSIALFCPEQHTYKDFTDKMWEAGTTTGQAAYDAQIQAFANENTTWVNSNGNPASTSASWKGVSGYVLERSVINAMPFTTSFAVGNGKHRFVKGQKLNTQDWYATSVQSILPTWRYWIENQGDLKVSIDWDDAYNLGNSLKVSGTIADGDHLWRLYKTMIPVSNGGKLTLVFKGSAPEVKLATSSSTTADVTLSGAVTSTSGGWTVAEYDLASLNGKTIYMIALNLKGSGNYDFKLGELSILPAGYAPAAPAINDFICTGDATDADTDIRMSWSYDYNNDFDHFDIYLTNAKGRKLAGQTRGEGFYIPRFNREGSEANVKAELVAVMKDGRSETLKSIDMAFRAAAPVVTVTPVKSYARVGERVVLKASGTDNPTSYAWTLPSTVKLVSGSLTDAEIEVEALAEGAQNVTVKVGNAQGTSTFSGNAFDVFSEIAYKEVHNAAIGKVIAGRSRAVTGEASYLIDGDVKPSAKDNCWSDISTNPYVTVDLKTPHTVYGFNIYDNHSAFKSGEDNIQNYRIYVSSDNKEWTEVVNARNVMDENIHTSNIVPTVARYVKLQPYADKRFTCRLFELEVIGRDNSKITVDAPHNLTLEPKSTQEVTVNYNMNGEAKADNFALQLSSESSYITCSEPQDDNNGHFTFTINTAKKVGKAELNVALVNGDAKRQTYIEVVIDSESAKNCLSGTEAEMRKYDADYVTGGTYTSQKTGNLTDGDTRTEGLTEEMYEDPCTSRNDLWAVFTNPRMFSLGKVKVYIPNNNKGWNANDKEGYVNNAISIRTSKDGLNWTVIETFDNLKEVSELTCYFPEMDPFTYLAVVCDVNTYFYPSLAEVEAYAQLEQDGPSIAPLTIANGFNVDIIAEATPVEDKASFDFDYSAFFTSNVQADGAISSPDSRMIITKQGTTFELAPYDGMNALNVNAKNKDYVLTFDEPVNAQKIYLLATCTSTREVTAIINYEDGTSSKEYTIDVPRADYGSDEKDSFAFTDLKLIERNGTVGRTNYGFNEVVLEADEDKAAVSVTLSASKSVDFWVLGVSALADMSGSKMKITPLAKNITIAPEADGEIIVKYDLKGEERQDNFSCSATVDNSCIALGDIKENAAETTFTLPIKAVAEEGFATVEFELVNGEFSKTCQVRVSIDTPSEFTGWNVDVIAESTPADKFTTGSYDNDGWALYTTDVQEKGALASADRIVETSNGTRFKLEPYDANNAIVLERYKPMTLTMVEPQMCKEVRLLGTTGKTAEIIITLSYAEGDDEEITDYITLCHSKPNIAAAYGFGGIYQDAEGWSYDVDDIDTDYNIGLCELAIPTDKTRALKSITLESQTSKAYPAVLSLAKVASESGINNIFADTDRTITGIYNLMGVKVNNPSNGIFIVKYSDVTAAKIFIK